jgi:hypothetical protein
LNQRLLIDFSPGVDIFEIPASLQVWDVSGIVEEVIPGSEELLCATHDNISHCVLAFTPDSGCWPADSSIGWIVTGGWGEEIQELLSGGFQTTDWLSAANAKEGTLEGEWLVWYDADGMCIGEETLSGSFHFTGHYIEPGSVLELWMEREDESILAAIEVLHEGGDIDLDLDIWVAASEAETCFDALIRSPEGAEVALVEGPCLEWGAEEDDESLGHRLFCATASGSGKTSGIFFGLMGLLTVLRRQRQ